MSYNFCCFTALVSDSSVKTTEEICFTLPDVASYSMEFENVLADVALELSKSNEQNLERVKNVCHSFTNGQGMPLLSQEDKDHISACESILDVFIVMQTHWNWCSHHLLMIIIQQVKSPTVEEILRKFEEKIDNSMKLKTIYEKFKKQVPQEYCKMIAIIDKNYSEITLEEWLKIESLVSKYLNVPQPPSEIKQSQSIESVWYVSTAAVESLKVKASQHKEVFCNESFIFLKVGDVIVFDTRGPLSPKVCNSCIYCTYIHTYI